MQTLDNTPVITTFEYATRSLTAGESHHARSVSVSGMFILMQDGSTRDVLEFYDENGEPTTDIDEIDYFTYMRRGGADTLDFTCFHENHAVHDLETFH